MAGWKVQTRGFKELQTTLREAPRRIQDEGRAWAKEVAEDETKYIRREAPSRTGRFRKTIVPYAYAMVVGVRFLTYPKLGLKLKNWIVKGTKPHIITARRAKALRFYWTRKRKWVLFKRVWHKGTRPNDFVTRGAIKFNPRVRFWILELGKRIEKVLSGKRK